MTGGSWAGSPPTASGGRLGARSDAGVGAADRHGDRAAVLRVLGPLDGEGAGMTTAILTFFVIAVLCGWLIEFAKQRKAERKEKMMRRIAE